MYLGSENNHGFLPSVVRVWLSPYKTGEVHVCEVHGPAQCEVMWGKQYRQAAFT